MPKTHEMKESKFLKKEDVGTGALLTITGCEQQNVAKDDQDPELKWVLTFKEAEKPLILNSTNIAACERICESDDTDDWIGKQIVLYNDENVSFGGKITGGIRIRAPKLKPAKAAIKKAPVAVAVAVDPDDDIPF